MKRSPRPVPARFGSRWRCRRAHRGWFPATGGGVGAGDVNGPVMESHPGRALTPSEVALRSNTRTPVKPWKNRLLVAALAPLLLVGLRHLPGPKIAAGRVTGSGGTYARDDDPELVRDAVPFALKTMEWLLANIPEDVDLLTALTSNFTQYAYAFVQQDADIAEMEGRSTEARAGRERARKLFLRARDYGLRALDELYAGLAYRLRAARDLEPALDRAEEEGRRPALLDGGGLGARHLRRQVGHGARRRAPRAGAP